jgi:hypothetical protein
MSDVKAIRYLLAHDAGLTAVVSAVKIMASVIPQNTVLPAIAISSVSTIRRRTVSAGSTGYCTARVQVTVQAVSYVQQKQILGLVHAALPNTRGDINDVNVDSILHEMDGPDWLDNEAGIFMQTVDYMVTYNE